MKNEDKIEIDKILKLRRREINNLFGIDHQNIIKLIQTLQTRNNCYLVFEYASGDTLKQFQQRCGGRLSEDQALYLMVQLAEGLKALYENKVLHRSLDPENIILSDTSSKPILKICDFALSKQVEDEGQGCTKLGIQPYMAFELIQGQGVHDYKVDLWSTGVILYELLTGSKPFQGISESQLMANQLLGPNLEVLRCSEQCKDLISKLLLTNPQERINFEDFYNHP